jgi:hypothetical protein
MFPLNKKVWDILLLKNSGIKQTKVRYKAPTVVNLVKIVSIYSAVLSPGLIPGIIATIFS